MPPSRYCAIPYQLLPHTVQNELRVDFPRLIEGETKREKTRVSRVELSVRVEKIYRLKK